MTDSGKKNLEQIDREISDCKQRVNLSESMILSQLTKISTPAKEPNRIGMPKEDSTNCLGRSRTMNDSPGLQNIIKSA